MSAPVATRAPRLRRRRRRGVAADDAAPCVGGAAATRAAGKSPLADAGGIVGWSGRAQSPPPRGSPLKERPKAGIGLPTSAPLPPGKAKGDPQLQALIEKAERETRSCSPRGSDK